MLSHEEFVAIKDRAADLFLPLPGVELVGVGGRERDGLDVDERVIKVFVHRKKAPEELPAEHLIPATFEGVGVDVVGMDAPGPTLPTVTLAGVSEVPKEKGDYERHRPMMEGKSTLVAGTAVNPDVASDRTHGTLGCFLVDSTDPKNKVYALSNFHVFGFSQDEEAVPGKTKVGQPTHDGTCCSSNNIGTYVYGGFGGPTEPKPVDATFDATVDAAIVQLAPGTNWRPWIHEGQWPIKGTATVPRTSDNKLIPIGVKKRGVRTRMTGGVVVAIDAVGKVGYLRNKVGVHTGTFRNLIIVQPGPDTSAKPPLYFGDEGDSGSAVLDQNNNIIGLLFAGFELGDNIDDQHPDPTSPKPDHTGYSRVIPIDAVLTFLRAKYPNLQVAVDDGQVHTVPKPPKATAAVAVPAELHEALADAVSDGTAPLTQPLPGTPALAPDIAARVRDDLANSIAGRRILRLWSEHASTLRGLLKDNRQLAVAWYRNGGAALFQVLLRMPHQPELALPSTVDGVPLAEVLDRIRDDFAAHVDPALKSELARARSAVPDIAGLTYAGVIEALEAPSAHA